LTYDLDL